MYSNYKTHSPKQTVFILCLSWLRRYKQSGDNDGHKSVQHIVGKDRKKKEHINKLRKRNIPSDIKNKIKSNTTARDMGTKCAIMQYFPVGIHKISRRIKIMYLRRQLGRYGITFAVCQFSRPV